MTTCLILAAGDAERHNGGNKPLLEVCGESLLARTVRLLSVRKWLVRIVTHRTDLLHEGISRCVPKGRRWVTETLLSTRQLWPTATDGLPGYGTIVLLGDVFYTEQAIRRITISARQISAFGKGFNIHALLWFSEHNERIEQSLAQVVKMAEEHPRMHGAGKLWFWLQCNPDIPVVDFNDETTDFDSLQEHKRFIEKYAGKHPMAAKAKD